MQQSLELVGGGPRPASNGRECQPACTWHFAKAKPIASATPSAEASQTTRDGETSMNTDQPPGPALQGGKPPSATSSMDCSESVGTVPGDLAQALIALAQSNLPAGPKLSNFKSAIRTTGRVLNLPLDQIPTEPEGLRGLLVGATLARAEISHDRWIRVKSTLLGALKFLNVDIAPSAASNKLTPEWQMLYDSVPDKAVRIQLSRFVHYLSSSDINPTAVDAAALWRFRDDLLRRSLKSDVQLSFTMAARAWNRAVNGVPGWPAVVLDLPSDARKYALPIEAFPSSFRDDVSSFLASDDDDPLSDNFRKPMRPSTIAHRRKSILQVATALSRSGVAPAAIHSLQVLVDPENARRALSNLVKHRDVKKSVHLQAQANLLRIIAKYWVRAPQHTVDKLKAFRGNLSPRKQSMTDRNSVRLYQFDIKKIESGFLRCPSKHFPRL